MTPEDLVEIERIRQLKARYFQLMDQKHWDEWSMVFCEDVTIDTTQEGSPLINGRKEFLDYLLPILEGVQTVHHGHMSQIEITSSTTATATWSMEDMLWWPPERGGQKIWGMGWYFEEYRKEADGEWRILDLKLRRIRVEVNGKQQFPPPA
ncbi:MAG: nuclear transport factor 2 family protein [Myxococcales bacterium]|nr:nuclear transport factor 2 family protein [Myxococcales bacterium]